MKSSLLAFAGMALALPTLQNAGIDATQTSASVTSKTLGSHNDWRPSQAIGDDERTPPDIGQRQMITSRPRPWPGDEKARNAARYLGGSG
ncbi:hypothetical protein FOQG_13274 [Fusarium oxysporum f. sp. raphani 54005]|uniref:Uncharacterized protein n=6 Tax=Fusarium oxysporum TaxID=5507 RepID=X0BJS0_FUSOX|nr:hypothetical protein FOVG_14290 [Fusarium oxysporum f. sp. pisi HDV247]EXK82405.1 hypothetical protein FOQG_13274 [Fusarium oxysporum f. sp. raphani 54005]EXL75565.1 hypothetical protein FOPG_09413 [Fusarium oxysporum f. sp. conglutinans race 2 54008]KAF6513692.1 hypothetical protein HZS61_007017 [Fusarium oxysporum f. sp. conglutinans]KAG7426066.1 hypothetical protein Forpi1262_v012742 [Fusarium oxysporum f. sp. raphani]KAJ4055484.1 hypothetical protein NW753_006240 [Fusarium oxysporum]WK